jgi:PAS domain S-box-containing protein
MKTKRQDKVFNLYNQESLFAVLERISDAFVALDNKWCYTYMNKKAGLIFNRDPLKMIGRHIWTEFPEAVSQPFYKAYYRAMETQEYIYLEEYYPPYNKWFENHIYPSPDGLTIYFRDITRRKIEEEQMRTDKARLLKSQDMGELGYWELERNSDKIWGSEKACELFGFPPVAGDIPINIIEPLIGDIAKVKEAGKKLDKKGEKFDMEVRIYPADGHPLRIISAVAEIENDLSGNPHKIIGIIKDITEQKRIEMLDVIEKEVLEQFSDSTLEDLLTFLLNSIKKIHPDMLCSVLKEKNGRLYNWASPHLPDAYNRKVEGTEIGLGNGSCGTAAFLRKKVEVSDIFHHPYWSNYLDVIKDFDMKACWSYPIINSRNELMGTFGIYHNTIRTLSHSEENSINRIRTILIYIIEKKLAENKAGLYKERLELTFNGTTDILFLLVVDKENKFRFSVVNQNFLNATGLDRTQVEGKRVEEVIPEPSCSMVLSKYREAVEKRTTISWDETTEYPSGRKTAIVTIRPVFLDEECINLVGSVHDITERKNSEELIRKKNEELKLKNDLLLRNNHKLSEIAWLQSHKVRAPLARIMGLINLVPVYKERNEAFNEFTDLISASANELDDIIRDIIIKSTDPHIPDLYSEDPEVDIEQKELADAHG